MKKEDWFMLGFGTIISAGIMYVVASYGELKYIDGRIEAHQEHSNALKEFIDEAAKEVVSELKEEKTEEA